MTFKIKGLNHLVLFTSNLGAAEEFYREVLDFQVVERVEHQAVFLRANGSDNHHDLGLINVGQSATKLPAGPHVGLYHSAWEVEAIEDLAKVRSKLKDVGVFIGESDHGNSLSVYAHDPDGNEFEVFWMVPREEWDRREFGVHQLHLDDEIKRRAKQ